MKKRLLIALGLGSILLTSCNLTNSYDNGKTMENDVETSSEVKYEQVYNLSSIRIERSDTYDKLEHRSIVDIDATKIVSFHASNFGSNPKIKNINIVENNCNMTTYGNSIITDSTGEGKVEITVVNDEMQLAKITLFIRSYDYRKELRTIEKIYVGNSENGIYVDEKDNVTITGNVFLKYKEGAKRSILNDPELKISTSLSLKENCKKVTLSYKNKEISYDVEINKTANSISKTKLKENYYTLNQNGVYKNYTTLNSIGDTKTLVLPIWLGDSDKYISETMVDKYGYTQKEQVLNDLVNVIYGEPIFDNHESVKSYFYNESFGRFNASFKFSEWIEMPNFTSESDYFNDRTTRNNLIKGAYQKYKSLYSDDIAYDNVMIYIGSNGYNSSMDNFASYIMNDNYLNIPRYTFGSLASLYSWDSTIDSISLHEFKSTRREHLYQNVSIHEFAHTFGIPDLYDLSTGRHPSGTLNMQSYGIAGHTAFERMCLGWIDPYILSSDRIGEEQIELTINDIDSSGDCIVLTNKWNSNDSPFDEYIVIELYAETGVNSYVHVPNNNIGVRVYHVDGRLYDNTNGFTTSINNGVIALSNMSNDASTFMPEELFYKYCNYDILHLIRSDRSVDYNTTDYGGVEYWFKEGDIFNMTDYAKQFPVEGKLDTGEDFNWEFEIKSITTDSNGGAQAKIVFTKK